MSGKDTANSFFASGDGIVCQSREERQREPSSCVELQTPRDTRRLQMRREAVLSFFVTFIVLGTLMVSAGVGAGRKLQPVPAYNANPPLIGRTLLQTDT